MCLRSSDQFYIVTYYIKQVTTSWTHSIITYYIKSSQTNTLKIQVSQENRELEKKGGIKQITFNIETQHYKQIMFFSYKYKKNVFLCI